MNAGNEWIVDIDLERFFDTVHHDRLINIIMRTIKDGDLVSLKPHLKSIEKLKCKLKQLTKRSWSISLDKRIQKLKWLIIGWVNYFKIANMKSVLAKLDSKLRAKIRIIIWKQWKVSKKRIESLVKLGIDREEAKGITYSRKGYQFVGHSKVIQKAISNRILEARGLPSMTVQYLKVHTIYELNRRIREPYVRWCEREENY